VITPVVNFCWGVFKWGLALGFAVALVAGGYFYLRLDEEVCQLARQALTNFYPGLETEVGSATYSSAGGLTMRNVRISAPDEPADEPLLVIEQLTLTGRLDPAALIAGKAQVECVQIVRPTVHIRRAPDGQWNLLQLYRPPQTRRQLPVIEIAGATARLCGSGEGLTLAPITAQVTNRVDERGMLELTIAGEQQGEFLRGGRLNAVVTLPDRSFRGELTIPTAELTDTLLRQLPEVTEFIPADLCLRGHIAGALQVSSAGPKAPLTWKLQLQASNGELQHPRWPRGVSQVSFGLTASEAGAELTDLRGLSGVTTLTGSGSREGWQRNSPASINVKIERAALEDQLFGLLSESARAAWQRIQPQGEFDLTCAATFDGRQWRPSSGELICRGVTLADATRPQLKLSNITGPVRLQQHPSLGPTAHAKLTATALGQGLTITAALHDFFPTPASVYAAPTAPVQSPLGWVEVICPRLPLSPEILSLPPDEKVRMVLAQLQPRGEVAATVRIDKTQRDQPKPTARIALDLLGLSFQYEKFPYPVTNVTGHIEAVDGVWTATDMVGNPPGSDRVVRGSGSLTPTPNGKRLQASIQAQQAPLDERLYKAIPTQVQAAWRQLQPRGEIDFTAEVEYFTGQPRPSIRLALAPSNRNVALQPTFNETGYRIPVTEVDGQFFWNNGVLTFTGARAMQGRSRLAGDGSWSPLPGGGWELTFTNAYADRLHADPELLPALPLGLRSVIEQLQATGTFGIHSGNLTITNDAPGAAPMKAAWQLALDCNQAEIKWGVPLRGVNGVVNLAGRTDGLNCKTAGEVNFSSAIWNNLQFTNVRGPLWMDREKCLLGRGVAIAQKEHGGQDAEQREMTAEAYSGRVQMSARVLHQQQGMFGLTAAVDDIDIARLAREGLGQQRTVAGRLDGTLELNGQGTYLSSLVGSGAFDIQDANFYELPILISLLKVLRNRAPDTNAFDRCQAQFRLNHGTIAFDKLNFTGDAISLDGAGEVGFDRRVDLVFHSILGRHDNTLPSIRSLLGQASEQFWRLKVTGTVDAPDIQREALPMVNNMLGQLQQTPVRK